MKDSFHRIARFFKNEPNLKALFNRAPAEQDNRPPSPAERARKRNKLNLFFFLFFPLSVFYMEVMFLFSLGEGVSVVTLLLLFLFSFSFGFLINGIALLLPLKINRILTFVTLFITTLLIVSQCVYYRVFGDFYTVSMISMGANAIENFSAQMFEAINRCWLALVFIFIPLVIFIANYRNYKPAFSPTFSFRIYLFVAALLLHLLAIGIVGLDKADIGNSNHYYYYNEFDAKQSIKRFGVMTNMRLDVKAAIFGVESPDIDNDISDQEVTVPFSMVGDAFNMTDDIVGEIDLSTDAPSTSVTGPSVTGTSAPKPPEKPPVIEYGDNVMDIDFETLIANEKNADIKAMHEYFSKQTPTKKNEFTGVFEGKNLIFLTLEGFSYKTIDKERTPTLYKMANEGFVFKNFYTSLWGGSTATGEYAAMSGNFHSSAKCLGMLKNHTMPFALGTQFNKLGYTVYAFHNHDYSYYSRNLSHEAMGYEYYGIGNGLEKAPINENGDTMKSYWPRSDHEMALATLPYFINSEKPFHIYYMTVSGHANYNFGGNNMCKKHKDIVADLDCSDSLKAFHACQYEVELMLAELVDALDKAGKLNDTVFVMSADHYPYALTADELKELYGISDADVYDNLDLLRNSFIIWSASMKSPVTVNKPCSSIDILPTVSNLFGLEYDSRLMMGTDVLSDSDPLVILNALFTGPSWCWLNRYGVYNSSTKSFAPASGFAASDEQIATYTKQMNNILWAKRKYSPMILEKDYYSYIFK